MMAKYEYKYYEIHKVIREKSDVFDTEDQKKWDELRACIIENYDNDQFQIKIEASKDPLDWLYLYQLIPAEELEENKKPRWISVENGGYEDSYELWDENGNLIKASDV